MWMGGRSLAVYSHNRVIAHRELDENRANRVAFKQIGKHGTPVNDRNTTHFSKETQILFTLAG